jgi:hypothetical protein
VARPAPSGEPALAGLAVCAARWLLRGGTWEALAREIAFATIQATRADHGEMEWLTPLVQAQLAERFDELQRTIAATSTSSRTDHLGRWPNDVDGAATVAALDGYDEGVHLLGSLYYDVLAWSVALVLDRRRRQKRRPRWRRSRRNVEQDVVVCDIPRAVADELTRSRDRFGWPRPRVAQEGPRPG